VQAGGKNIVSPAATTSGKNSAITKNGVTAISALAATAKIATMPCFGAATEPDTEWKEDWKQTGWYTGPSPVPRATPGFQNIFAINRRVEASVAPIAIVYVGGLATLGRMNIAGEEEQWETTANR